MTATKPLLYVSRLLPDPVMVAIRERFTLVREPIDTTPSLSDLQEGLSKAAAAIVTLTDRIDAQTLESARELKVLANYAVGYNNIDVDAAQRRAVDPPDQQEVAAEQPAHPAQGANRSSTSPDGAC